MKLHKISFEPVCDRCEKTTRMLRPSFFNFDILCPECEEKEKQHPRYPEAKQTLFEAYTQGDKDFPGIGKPSNL